MRPDGCLPMMMACHSSSMCGELECSSSTRRVLPVNGVQTLLLCNSLARPT
jgi:hypothetical protein